MPSSYETFWNHDRYAVVGRDEARFPKLTYRGLKESGKTVYPVSTDTPAIDGDPTFADFTSLPQPVDGVVIEVPKEETRDWVARAAEAGIHNVWIHMNRETPEALDLAREKGLDVRYGTCAVMYVTAGFTFHSIHKMIRKVKRTY